MTLTTKLFLLSFATLAVLHLLLLEFYLYWRFPWVDIGMHVFGGIVLALGVFALGDVRVRPLLHFRTLIGTIGIVLFVALAWELYEYIIWNRLLGDNYYFDTTLDLVAGVVGGVVGYILARGLNELRT